MRMCDTHYEKLTTKLDDSSVHALMARPSPSEEVTRFRAAAELDGMLNAGSFDPLVLAYQQCGFRSLGAIEGRVFSMAADACFCCEWEAHHDRNCEDDACPGGQDVMNTNIDAIISHVEDLWADILASEQKPGKPDPIDISPLMGPQEAPLTPEQNILVYMRGNLIEIAERSRESMAGAISAGPALLQACQDFIELTGGSPESLRDGGDEAGNS